MAYIPYDPYNTGINTIGTDLGLGNINQGQNIQVADASIEALLNKERERKGLGPTEVKETFPRYLADEYETYKEFMGGPGATESIVDEYKGTYPGLLDVPIEDLQQRFEIGLENPDLMQVKADDDEYDFSGIKDQTAGLQWLVPAAKEYWKKKMLANMALEGTGILRKIGTDYIKKKKKKTSTTTSGGQKIITKKKKTSAPPGEKGGPGYIPPKHKPSHQTGGSGGVHSGMKTTKTSAPQRDYSKHSAYGLKQGGLVNFFKYGGFLG